MTIENQRNLAVAALLVLAVGAGGYWLGSRGGGAGSSPPGDGVPGRETAAPVPVPTPSVATAPLEESRPAASPPLPARRDDSEAWRERRRPDPVPAVVAPPEAAPPTEVSDVETGAVAAEPLEAPRGPDAVVVLVPPGTKISVRLRQAVSSQTSRLGDEVTAELAAPVLVDGLEVLAAGTEVLGRVDDVRAIGKIGGQARLGIAFESLRVHDRRLPIAASWARQGKSETGKDAAAIAIGAVAGTILGNQARHNDRGKVVGGAAGAGIGAAVAAGTAGETVELAPGAQLTVTLREGLEVTVTR